MSAVKMYYQCRLHKDQQTTTGWIEQRGAKVGVTVELLPGKELWKVGQVFLPAIREDLLKEHQRLNRGSLPSIERMN